MTYLHFLNCLSLTFAPLVLTYRSTALSEGNGYPTLVSIFFYYVLLQGIKLFVLACLPSSLLNLNDTTTNDGFSMLVEISRIFLDTLISIFGMIYSYRNARFINKLQPSTLRILCIALGWSFAHSITHYLVPLWSARGIEFNWKYTFMAIKSNLNFLLTLSMSAVLYNDYINVSVSSSSSGGDSGKEKGKQISATSIVSMLKMISPRIYIMFTVVSVLPSIPEFLTKVLSFDAFTCMLLQIVATAVIVISVYVTVGSKTLKSD